MNIHCPYCFSEDVVRVVREQHSSGSGSHMAASATFATLGASLSKTMPIPVPPVVGGIAGAVVGGLLDSFAQPSQPRSISCFYCHNCQRNFH